MTADKIETRWLAARERLFVREGGAAARRRSSPATTRVAVGASRYRLSTDDGEQALIRSSTARPLLVYHYQCFPTSYQPLR